MYILHLSIRRGKQLVSRSGRFISVELVASIY